MADQAFVIYRMVVQAAAATPRIVPLRNFTHDLEAIAEAVTPRTRLVFLANPNNPTGTIFRRAAWEAFLRALPPRQLIVVADDAYAEYVEDPEYPDTIARARRRQRAGRDAAHVLEALRPRGAAHRLRRRARRRSSRRMRPRPPAVQRERARAGRRARRARRRRARAADARGEPRGHGVPARRRSRRLGLAVRAERGELRPGARRAGRRGLRGAAPPRRHRAADGRLRLPRAPARHVGLPEENERFLEALAAVPARRAR